jgi:hypothetical protein
MLPNFVRSAPHDPEINEERHADKIKQTCSKWNTTRAAYSGRIHCPDMQTLEGKDEKVSLTRPISKFIDLVSLYRKLNGQGLHLEQELWNCLCNYQCSASKRSHTTNDSPFFWRDVREMLDKSVFHGLVASIAFLLSLLLDQLLMEKTRLNSKPLRSSLEQIVWWYFATYPCQSRSVYIVSVPLQALDDPALVLYHENDYAVSDYASEDEYALPCLIKQGT